MSHDDRPRCFRVGCPNAGTHHIGMRIWGAGEVHLPARAIDAWLPMPLCEQHAREAAASPDHIFEHAFDIESWAVINRITMLQGRIVPHRQDIEFYVKEGLVPSSPPERAQ